MGAVPAHPLPCHRLAMAAAPPFHSSKPRRNRPGALARPRRQSAASGHAHTLTDTSNDSCQLPKIHLTSSGPMKAALSRRSRTRPPGRVLTSRPREAKSRPPGSAEMNDLSRTPPTLPSRGDGSSTSSPPTLPSPCDGSSPTISFIEAETKAGWIGVPDSRSVLTSLLEFSRAPASQERMRSS